MATAKELLAQKLKQNSEKHQLAQKENINVMKITDKEGKFICYQVYDN